MLPVVSQRFARDGSSKLFAKRFITGFQIVGSETVGLGLQIRSLQFVPISTAADILTRRVRDLETQPLWTEISGTPHGMRVWGALLAGTARASFRSARHRESIGRYPLDPPSLPLARARELSRISHPTRHVSLGGPRARIAASPAPSATSPSPA